MVPGVQREVEGWPVGRWRGEEYHRRGEAAEQRTSFSFHAQLKCAYIMLGLDWQLQGQEWMCQRFTYWGGRTSP